LSPGLPDLLRAGSRLTLRGWLRPRAGLRLLLTLRARSRLLLALRSLLLLRDVLRFLPGLRDLLSDLSRPLLVLRERPRLSRERPRVLDRALSLSSNLVPLQEDSRKEGSMC
jgi:hypothetical protein